MRCLIRFTTKFLNFWPISGHLKNGRLINRKRPLMPVFTKIEWRYLQEPVPVDRMYIIIYIDNKIDMIIP